MAFTKADWWHIDGEGRRIGWLFPEDMEAILESHYGAGTKWVSLFAADFGFHRSAVDRWRKGLTPIPKHVAMIVNMVGTFNVRKIPLSPVDASWLPDVGGSNAKESNLVVPPQKPGPKKPTKTKPHKALAK